VGADFGDGTLVQHDDAVGPANRGQPVGDEEHRAVLQVVEQVVADPALGVVVEGAGGFIEHQQARL